MRRLSVFGFLLSVILFAGPALHACAVCYGNPNDPMVKGTNNGILFLLGVVGFLWIGFAALFISFWMRGRELRRRREEFHLIQGGAH